MLQLHVDRMEGVQAIEGHENAAVGRLAARAIAPLQAALVDEDVPVIRIDPAEAVVADRAVVALDDLETQPVRSVIADAAQVGPGFQAVGAHDPGSGRIDVAERVVDDGDADRVVDLVGELDERMQRGCRVGGLGIFYGHQRRLPVVRDVKLEGAVIRHADEHFVLRRDRGPVGDDHLADLHVVVGLVRQRHGLVGIAEREQRVAARRLGDGGRAVRLEDRLAAVVVDDVVDLERAARGVADAMSAVDAHVDGLGHRAVRVHHQRGAGPAFQNDVGIPRDTARAARIRAVDFRQQRERGQHGQVVVSSTVSPMMRGPAMIVTPSPAFMTADRLRLSGSCESPADKP